jgi:hypothetical protein
MIIYILLLVYLLLLIWYWSINRIHIIFPPVEDSVHYISQDIDGHIRSLNIKDLRDRKCVSREKYMGIYLKSIQPFSTRQKILIKKYTLLASKYISTLKSPHIETALIIPIPWKFVLVDESVEYGHPHTRGDMIFLSKRSLCRSGVEITRTLIHEKIHIYQKMYPELFVKSLINTGYVHLGELEDGLRSKNPDTNSCIYMHPNGRVMNGADVIYEHPNELIAYTIARQYSIL